MAWIYILRCSDDTLYVGHCDDLETRIERHEAGVGGMYTSARLPVTLVYSEQHPTIDAARLRERQLKRWSSQKKTALLNGDLTRLKNLSKRRRPTGR